MFPRDTEFSKRIREGIVDRVETNGVGAKAGGKNSLLSLRVLEAKLRKILRAWTTEHCTAKPKVVTLCYSWTGLLLGWHRLGRFSDVGTRILSYLYVPRLPSSRAVGPRSSQVLHTVRVYLRFAIPALIADTLSRFRFFRLNENSRGDQHERDFQSILNLFDGERL